MSVKITEIPVDGQVEIFGHTFDGFKEIKAAVEATCSLPRYSDDEPRVYFKDPQQPVSGVHVANIYAPFPCFDSEDYGNENRNYDNFFFSTVPFTEERIKHLAMTLDHHFNACMVNENMPDDAAPAVYRNGDWRTMTLAL